MASVTSSSTRFKAFISYSHAADGQLAPVLQHALQTFTKPWYAPRACRIFRDQTTLAVTPTLWPAIERALLDSEWFVLLASPAAAQSPWVNDEVACWCRARSVDRILLVLTDGEIAWSPTEGDFDWARSTALPPALRGKARVEPLHLDLRWARGEAQLSRRHPRFLEAVADLASTLHDVAKDELVGREVQAHRRTRRVVKAVVAMLLVLTAAAVVAAVKANAALRLAEQRRVQARAVAESIVFEVDETLQRIPEAARSQVSLRSKARDLLDRLSGAESDLRLTRASMVLHVEEADAAIARGQPERAREALLECLRHARSLQAQDPMSRQSRRDVAACSSRLGALLTTTGDLSAAQRYLEEDVRLTRELLTEQPGDRALRLDLATSLEKLGNLCVARRERGCAAANLAEDLRMMRELVAEAPGDPRTQRGLSVALVQYGEMRLQHRELDAARTALTEAVSLWAAQAEAAPSDGPMTRSWSVALLKLGDVETLQRDAAAAQPHFVRALALRRGLLARAPDDEAMQRDVAVILGRVGSASAQLQDTAGAVAALREAVALYEALAALPDATDETRRELALNAYDLAGILARAGDYAAAGTLLTRSVALFRAVEFQSPLSFPRQELFQALRRGGLVELELGHAAEAADRHRQACQLLAEVADEALDVEAAMGAVLDLAQMAEAQHRAPAGDGEVGRMCGAAALARGQLLRKRDEAAWGNEEVQDVLGGLRTWVPESPAADGRAR